MITLFELHWSHYCEKIRLVLDVSGLPWKTVGIDAFTKREMAGYPIPAHLPNRTVPAILDEATGEFVMDSTPIVRYLARTYPQVAKLFPGDESNRAEIDQRLVEFDSVLGIGARRFGYIQVILECPELLPSLFLSHRANGFFCRPLISRISAAVLGMLLSKRFDFHRSDKTGMYEALERYLLKLAQELDGREFIVGEQLSVADLAFAAQMRPLTIVPFFTDNPALQSLFARHRQLLQKYSNEPDSRYQVAIASARARKAPVRRRLRTVTSDFGFHACNDLAANDHRVLWDWAMWLMPFHYWITLRRGKRRLAVPTVGYR